MVSQISIFFNEKTKIFCSVKKSSSTKQKRKKFFSYFFLVLSLVDGNMNATSLTLTNERFIWRDATGNEKSIPRLLAIDIKARMAFTRDFKDYNTARKSWYAARATADPAPVDLISEVPIPTRRAILSAAEFGFAEPVFLAGHKPRGIEDFDDISSRAARNRRDGIRAWIALEDPYEQARLSKARITVSMLLDRCEELSWNDSGPIVSMCEYFERLEREAAQHYPRSLVAGSEEEKALGKSLKKKAEMFRHLFFHKDKKILLGLSWADAVKERAMEA